jgi:hypothetical protein
MKKNFFKILSIFFLGFCLAQVASADVLFDPDTLDYNSTEDINVYCDTLDGFVVFDSNGVIRYNGGCDDNLITPVDTTNISGITSNQFLLGSFNAVNLPIDADMDLCLDYDSCLQIEGAIAYNNVFTITGSDLSVSGIFFGRDEEDGGSTANLLVASVGTATQTTFKSLGNILAVVGGVLVAFGAINWIVALIKETNDEKKRKKRI